MALESTRAETWIFQQLTGNTTLTGLLGNDPRGVPKIYAKIAYPSAALPYVVFQQNGGAGDSQTADGRRVMDREIWQVTVYSAGNDQTVYAPICDQVDATLHRKGGTVADGRVLSCLRQRTFPNDLQEENLYVSAQVLEFELCVQV